MYCFRSSRARLGEIDLDVIIGAQLVLDAIGQSRVQRRTPQKYPIVLLPDDLLRSIVDDPNRAISRLPLLSEAERAIMAQRQTLI